MKKHKAKPCPQLVPNKKKEMLKIVQNPEAMKRILDLQHAASDAIEKQKTIKAFDLNDWYDRVIMILPEEYQNNEELKAKIKNLIQETKDNDTQSE